MNHVIIIAEAGVNHNGNIENAFKLIDAAAEAGVDYIKFQTFNSEKVVSKFAKKADYQMQNTGSSNESQLEMVRKLELSVMQHEQLTTSTEHVSKYAQIGEGSVIMHQAVVNADAIIGRGCIINTFANIEHDARIGDYCHISTGAMINGNCVVGNETFFGSQSVMVNGLEITSGCIIGAGSLVRKNAMQKGIYSGNPASLKIKL